MAAKFSVDRKIYDGLLYDRMNSFTHDLPFYKRCARRAGGRVLEMCCGTGRLTIPLAQAGIRITGLDFTRSMLKRARKKAQDAGIDIKFVQGDMRSASLRKKFNLIFIPFNSLLNTYTASDILKVLKNVRRHLKRGGFFAFDIFNPDIHFLVRNKGRVQRSKYRFRLENGQAVAIDERCLYDSATQVNRVTWTIRVGARSFKQGLDMRCIFPLEMDALLHCAGFRAVKKYGDFRGSPFTSKSSKQVYVCKKCR